MKPVVFACNWMSVSMPTDERPFVVPLVQLHQPFNTFDIRMKTERVATKSRDNFLHFLKNQNKRKGPRDYSQTKGYHTVSTSLHLSCFPHTHSFSLSLYNRHAHTPRECVEHTHRPPTFPSVSFWVASSNPASGNSEPYLKRLGQIRHPIRSTNSLTSPDQLFFLLLHATFFGGGRSEKTNSLVSYLGGFFFWLLCLH